MTEDGGNNMAKKSSNPEAVQPFFMRNGGLNIFARVECCLRGA